MILERFAEVYGGVGVIRPLRQAKSTDIVGEYFCAWAKRRPLNKFNNNSQHKKCLPAQEK